MPPVGRRSTLRIAGALALGRWGTSGAEAAPAAGRGPAASGAFVNIDCNATTSKRIVRELFGISSSQIVGNNFARMNDATFAARAKSLNFPLLRFNCGNLWHRVFFGNPPGGPTWDLVTPLLNNLHRFVDLSKCKIIMGIGGNGNDAILGWTTEQFARVAAQIATYFKTTPGGDGRPINPMYWEIANEPSVSYETYNRYFNAAADALHEVNPEYVITGPVAANDGARVSSLIAAAGPTRLGMPNNHCYLYCPGENRVPSDEAVCQALLDAGGNGTSVTQFAADMNREVHGTYAANLPYFCGEYNVGCGPQDPHGREKTIIGACFAASWTMKLATLAEPIIWAGYWDLAIDGWYGTMDTLYNIYPNGYYLTEARRRMPGTLVAATNVDERNTLEAFATVNCNAMAVMLVNYSRRSARGQVAISRWPVNSSGTGRIRKWELSAAYKRGSITTVAVNTGMCDSITIPGQSVVILYA